MMHNNLAVSDCDFDIFAPPSTATDNALSASRYAGGIESSNWAQQNLTARFIAKVERHRREEAASDAAPNATTIDDLEHARARLALLELINSDTFQSLSFDTGISVVMNIETIRFARKFLAQLKNHQMLPQIAPDGEGDILMIWDRPPSLLITIEGKTLHPVAYPGTTRSRHLPSVEFDGEVVPSEIAALIPKP